MSNLSTTPSPERNEGTVTARFGGEELAVGLPATVLFDIQNWGESGDLRFVAVEVSSPCFSRTARKVIPVEQICHPQAIEFIPMSPGTFDFTVDLVVLNEPILSLTLNATVREFRLPPVP